MTGLIRRPGEHRLVRGFGQHEANELRHDSVRIDNNDDRLEASFRVPARDIEWA